MSDSMFWTENGLPICGICGVDLGSLKTKTYFSKHGGPLCERCYEKLGFPGDYSKKVEKARGQA